MGSVTAAIKSVWHSASVFGRQDVFEQFVPLRPHQIEQREHVRPTLIRCSSGLDFTLMQLPTETIDGVSELGVSQVATISQNAAVFGGGALGLKPEMSSVSRKAATCLSPPS